MSRKPKAESLKQKKVIPVRVTVSEDDLLTRASARSRLPVATFARIAALTEAERIVGST